MASSRTAHLFALIALASSVLPLAPLAAGADEAPKRSISLTATGAIRTSPDKVDITTGVTSQAPTAKEALAKNSAAMTEVVAALKAEGLDPKDIQTTNFTVQPLYEERKDGRSPNIVGYQVTNSVRLTVHDIGKLGAILDKVVTLGANEVDSIEFGVTEPEALKDEARKLAMRNAIDNAKLYAEAAGVGLGRILSISEDEGVIAARMPRWLPWMEGKSVPIEAGTTSVEPRVRVTSSWRSTNPADFFRQHFEFLLTKNGEAFFKSQAWLMARRRAILPRHLLRRRPDRGICATSIVQHARTTACTIVGRRLEGRGLGA